MSILAQLPDPSSYQAIGWILAGLVGLIVSINQIDDFIKRRQGAPPNEELKGTADVLNQRVAHLEKEAQEAMERRRKMHERIDGVQTAVREEIKNDIGDVYQKIDDTRRELATEITEVRKEMARMIPEVVAVIKNAQRRGS